MLFNSFEFAIYLPIVFALYWLANSYSYRLQNFIILFSSYVFYGWWDYRFLALIFFSSLVDYLVAIQIYNNISKKGLSKFYLLMSLIVNLGLLFYFKYFNFFLDNLNEAFTLFGMPIKSSSLNLILPVGISFYTFQTISYSIDVYRGKFIPQKDFIAFAAYVSFFPQLVAGPIERASNLLPQFFQNRKFDYSNAIMGMRQILWGLFKKIVIADNCASFANQIFDNYQDYNGSTLFLGAIFFTFQIYGDFSGYSDIAIGVSRLFGIQLTRNFAFPYFSRDMAEFWRRWHISLSTWFKDYLYIPLGGSHGSKLKVVRNTFIVFLVSGFWHGANWTFIVWGALNAIYFLPLLLLKRNRTHLGPISENRLIPKFKDVISILGTFTLTVLAWIFFRAESVPHALFFIDGIISLSLFDLPVFPGMRHALFTLITIILSMMIEWVSRNDDFTLEKIETYFPRAARIGFYYIIVQLFQLL